MPSKEQKDENTFYHKTGERLFWASTILVMVDKKELDNNKAQTLDSLKFLYRDFLDSILYRNRGFIIPERYSVEKLEEAYKKSDFDWKKPELFWEFAEWYNKNVEKK